MLEGVRTGLRIAYHFFAAVFSTVREVFRATDDFETERRRMWMMVGAADQRDHLEGRTEAQGLLDNLDPGIRDVVVFLRVQGFNTVSSCEGGHLYPKELPWVTVEMRAGDKTKTIRAKLAGTLAGGHYSGFTTSEMHSYQRGPFPWGKVRPAVMVTFWQQKPITPDAVPVYNCPTAEVDRALIERVVSERVAKEYFSHVYYTGEKKPCDYGPGECLLKCLPEFVKKGFKMRVVGQEGGLTPEFVLMVEMASATMVDEELVHRWRERAKGIMRRLSTGER